MEPDAFRARLLELGPPPASDPGVRCALRLVDDERLAWGDGHEPDLIVADIPPSQRAAASDWLSGHAERLLNEYYRIHPLTRAGFERQVAVLLRRHGAAAFAAVPGELPAYSLFVECGTVLAEARGAPRHRYGAFCELPAKMAPAAASARVEAWLAAGEAYEQYLGMNVCRYTC